MKTVVVHRGNGTNVEVECPDDTVMTFGPWSPPTGEPRNHSDRAGTLRFYRAVAKPDRIISIISGVTGFYEAGIVSQKVVAEPGKVVITEEQLDTYEKTNRELRKLRRTAAGPSSGKASPHCVTCGQPTYSTTSSWCADCLADEKEDGAFLLAEAI
jgi:hypothetical protein